MSSALLIAMSSTADGTEKDPRRHNNLSLKKRVPGRWSTFRDKISQLNHDSVKVISGKTVYDVPSKTIDSLEGRIISAFSAPKTSLTHVQSQRNTRRSIDNDIVSVGGITAWDQRPDEAYGISMSLYDHDVKLGRTVGDPIADCLSIVLRPNNSLLVLADGVSWGEKSKIAAWSAVYGCTSYLMDNLVFAKTTRDVFICLMSAFENAQSCIVEEDGTMTTLCAAVIVKLKDKNQWGLCVLNVGDSLAYVYNTKTGVREVTTGSHSIDEDRDMRNAGGSLGQVDGCNPDLTNLTCSFTRVEDTDIVFLTSDGISDNFDPAVGMFQPSSECVLKFNPKNCRKGSAQAHELTADANELLTKTRSVSLTNSTSRVEVTPFERHCGSLEKMTKVIEEENSIDSQVSAINVCASLANYALRNSQKKREIHESMDYDALKLLSSTEKRRTEEEHRSLLDSAPGKLDHASIAALQVGCYATSPPLRNKKSLNENDYYIINDKDMDSIDVLKKENPQMANTGYDYYQADQMAKRTFCDIR